MVMETTFGTACLAAARDWGVPDLCPNVLLLAAYLADARVRPDHPLQPYLASLPPAAPDPAGWPTSLRVLLEGTEVGVTVEAARG